MDSLSVGRRLFYGDTSLLTWLLTPLFLLPRCGVRGADTALNEEGGSDVPVQAAVQQTVQ
jgi:hypothetical protein